MINGCVKIEVLILNDKTSNWCGLPYHNHPKGCPNIGKKSTCPPTAPKIQDVIDTEKPMYLVYSEFNLEEHVNRMKKVHPLWTDYQCRCVLYWQPKSRKQLMDRIKQVVMLNGCSYVSTCPEAMGVNVYTTARKAGLILDPIKSMKICRHVAIVGTHK